MKYTFPKGARYMTASWGRIAECVGMIIERDEKNDIWTITIEEVKE